MTGVGKGSKIEGMRNWFFVLGTNHTLCKIDIINFWLERGVGVEVLAASEEVLIIRTQGEVEVGQMMRRLGSAAKIGVVEEVFPQDSWQERFEERYREKDFAGDKFGVSVYLAGGKFRDLNRVFEEKKELVKRLKEWWQGREIREEGRALSTVAVAKNNLLKEGKEFLVGVGEGVVFWGKTLAIQDYEDYSFRDYGRPRRDPKEGMIPPKLAKIMINLAKVSVKEVILDPFCGSGTIIQEAILMGYKNLIGMDLSEEAIKNSWENIRWLLENSKLKIQNSKLKLKIQKCDVRNLSQKILPKSVDAIITESYLGPVKKSEIKSQKLKIISELSELYIKAFREFGKVLKENRRIVIVFPILKLDGELNFLSTLDELKKIGWQVINPISEELRKNPAIKITNRDSVIYFRPDQTVLREILIFKMRS